MHQTMLQIKSVIALDMCIRAVSDIVSYLTVSSAVIVQYGIADISTDQGRADTYYYDDPKNPYPTLTCHSHPDASPECQYNRDTNKHHRECYVIRVPVGHIVPSGIESQADYQRHDYSGVN